MNYNETIKYIHSIPKFVRPLGNKNLGRLLEAMGNPQKQLKFIHVAGTNGKGSVCAMTAEILKCAGYKTGLFTSPYIEVFNERIQINNEMIDDDVLSEYITSIAALMEEIDAKVSEFAFITAAAMKYFADCGCDIVVLETGMGGKLDATNIIDTPECAALTQIGMDHMQYLGDTQEEIAEEKCGIIKHGGYVVSAANNEVINIIKQSAQNNSAHLVICQTAEKTVDGFKYKSKDYALSLKGVYQAENAAAVVEIIDILRNKGYNIPEKAVTDGFKNVRWKARYEFVTPDIVIDGGHNIDGIRALKKALALEERPVTLVLGMMKDKSYEQCIRQIITCAKCVVATEINIERALPSEEIKNICNRYGIKCICTHDTAKAIAAAEALADGGLICICGSLYLAGEAEKVLSARR